MSLITYQDFLDRVDELGFMALSYMLPGLPCLSEETRSESWHGDDPDADPWAWKDRAAEEKRLAYGCILGGHKGFVSARMYPLLSEVRAREPNHLAVVAAVRGPDLAQHQ